MGASARHIEHRISEQYIKPCIPKVHRAAHPPGSNRCPTKCLDAGWVLPLWCGTAEIFFLFVGCRTNERRKPWNREKRVAC